MTRIFLLLPRCKVLNPSRGDASCENMAKLVQMGPLRHDIMHGAELVMSFISTGRKFISLPAQLRHHMSRDAHRTQLGTRGVPKQGYDTNATSITRVIAECK